MTYYQKNYVVFSQMEKSGSSKVTIPLPAACSSRIPLYLRDLIADAKAGALEISYLSRSSLAKIVLPSLAASLRACSESFV